MNTGTARIVIIVALLVVGGLVLANGFTDPSPVAAAGSEPGTATSPSPSPTDGAIKTDSPAPTVEETPEPAAPKDIPVAVFNGTVEPGLAGTVMEELLAAGYELGQEPTDAPTKPVDETVVYFAGGSDAAQNESNATALADRYFKRAKVKELSSDIGDLVDRGVQVVVVLGTNDIPAA